MRSSGKPCLSPENKGEKHSFIEEMGTQKGCRKQSPLEETENLKFSSFHCLSSNSFHWLSGCWAKRRSSFLLE